MVTNQKSGNGNIKFLLAVVASVIVVYVFLVVALVGEFTLALFLKVTIAIVPFWLVIYIVNKMMPASGTIAKAFASISLGFLIQIFVILILILLSI